MREYFIKGTKLGDRMIPGFRRDIVRDQASPEYGAACTPFKGFGEPGNNGYIGLLIAAYYNPASAYYRREDVLEDALLAVRYICRKQHPDGTIDLRETTFHCASTVGFDVQVLAYAWRLAHRDSGGTRLEKELEAALFRFLKNGARGMKDGGFHTPNHRWVLASALALCANILGDDGCREMCMRYLAEGIDCDENGEYTERSAGIYNVVNNRSLIIVSEEMGMPELLEHVRRNLRMVPCYFEPDGTVFTMNSTRQDNTKKLYPTAYYENYMLMACKDKSPEFAGIAGWLFDRMERLAAAAPSDYALCSAVDVPTWLLRMLLDPSLVDTELPEQALPVAYHRFFRDSGIVRGRREDLSYTILANSPVFLAVQKGTSRVTVRFGSSFYAKGQMISPEITPIEGGYRLQYSYSWGYTRPFENGSPTPFWREMDHGARERVLFKTLTMAVEIREQDGGLALTFSSRGIDELPAKMEFAFEAGGYWETPDILTQTRPGDTLLLKQGSGTYLYDGETFTLSGGCMEHSYTAGMRGTEANDPARFTVYTTAMGQFEKTIVIQ